MSADEKNPYTPPLTDGIAAKHESARQLSELVRRGRTIMIVLIASTFAFEALILAVLLKLEMSDVIRLALTAALWYAVWKGKAWAKWLTVILFGITAILMLLFLFKNPTVMIVGVLVYSCAVVVVLTCSKSVDEFIQYQRGARSIDKT